MCIVLILHRYKIILFHMAFKNSLTVAVQECAQEVKEEAMAVLFITDLWLYKVSSRLVRQTS